MAILPCLYAWFCSTAFWDPYSNTGNVKVVVVNNDEPVHSELAGEMDIGNRVEEDLRENDKIGWTFVDNDENAKNMVRSGECYAAIIIPKDFSADFAAIFDETTDKGDESIIPQLQYYVNEKLNATATKITNAGASALEREIDTMFTTEMSKVLIEMLQSTTSDISEFAVNTRQDVANTLERTANSVGGIQSTIEGTRSSVVNTKNAISSSAGSLNGATSASNAAQNSAARGENAASRVEDALAGNSSSGASKTLQEVRAAAAALAGSSGLISSTGLLVSNSGDAITTVSDLLTASRDLIDITDTAIGKTRIALSNVAEALRSLDDSLISEGVNKIENLNPEELGSFIASPVELKSNPMFVVDNYGSAVAPFYANISLWVGCLILLAMVRLEVDPVGMPPMTPRQTYLGRGLFYLGFGTIQSIILTIGLFVIGVQCEHPVLFLATNIFVALTFYIFIYSLAASMRHIGKAIVILFLIVQIQAAGGMYPVELLPLPYQIIHPLLPYTYGVDAMREAMFGLFEYNILLDYLGLGVFIVISLFLGLFLRPRMLNLNIVFDRKLEETNVFASEERFHDSEENVGLKTALHAMLNLTAFRKRTQAQWNRFVKNYPATRRACLIALAASPIALLVIAGIISFVVGGLSINAKLALIVAWSFVFVVTAALVVYAEYTNETLELQVRFSQLSDGEIQDYIREHLADSKKGSISKLRFGLPSHASTERGTRRSRKGKKATSPQQNEPSGESSKQLARERITSEHTSEREGGESHDAR